MTMKIFYEKDSSNLREFAENMFAIYCDILRKRLLAFWKF